MTDNEKIMNTFYSAFQERDYRTMQGCYHDDAVFSDPAFGLLNADEVRDMWEMLCKNAKDLSIEFSDPESADEYGTCEWTAVYTFSQTGRKVVNKIKAYMKFADGKIIEHSDAFSLYTWMKQAFGMKGVLLGWSGFVQTAARKKFKKRLKDFMKRKNN